MSGQDEAVDRLLRSGKRVSEAGTGEKLQRMPVMFQGHVLKCDQGWYCKCMVCGVKTRMVCECGRATFGTSGGVTCWALHLEAVVAGTAGEDPLQWQVAVFLMISHYITIVYGVW